MLSSKLQNNQSTAQINLEIKDQFNQSVQQRDDTRKTLIKTSDRIVTHQKQHLQESTSFLTENQTLNLQALVSQTQLKKTELRHK